MVHGNPEPSLNASVEEGAETIPRGSTLMHQGIRGSARLPAGGLITRSMPEDDIVQSPKKFGGSCNRRVAGSNPARGAPF